MIVPREEQSPQSVASHYDELDRWYLEIWGEHVHHGLWLRANETPAEATFNLIQRLVERADIQPGHKVCDVGCGYGGTARVLAREFGAQVTGLTLSQAQWAYAQSQSDGSGNPEILQRDFFSNSFADGSFDAAISIESSEHMPDKAAFFAELYRILKPGGRLAVYAWLARPEPRSWEVGHFLEPICREGRLPAMGDEQDYRELIEAAGFQTISFEEYSRRVKKTWPIIIGRMAKRLAWDKEARAFLFRGPANRIFAKTVFRIWFAYEWGSMRYGLFTARKP